MVVSEECFGDGRGSNSDQNEKSTASMTETIATNATMSYLDKSTIGGRQQNGTTTTKPLWRKPYLLLLLGVNVLVVVATVSTIIIISSDDSIQKQEDTIGDYHEKWNEPPSSHRGRQLSMEKDLLGLTGQREIFFQYENEQPSYETNQDEKVQWLTSHWRNERLQVASTTSSTTTGRFFVSSSATTTKNHHPQVHVVQIGNTRYQQKFQTNTLLNKQWSKCAGYQYHLLTMEGEARKSNDSADCIYTKKVSAIQQFFSTLPMGDWMMFVDMDAYYQSPNCHELDEILDAEQQNFLKNNKEGPKCGMMFHMCSNGINSGILIFQKTPQTMELLQAWETHQSYHGFCHGPGDQWALQEILLRDYYKYDIDECLALEKGSITYSGRGHCSNNMLQDIKRVSEEYYFNNLLIKGRYSEYMEQHLQEYSLIPMLMGEDEQGRESDERNNNNNNICVFDCLSKKPLQCKDCDYDFLAKKRHPADGTRTCRLQIPLFHHSRDFLDKK